MSDRLLLRHGLRHHARTPLRTALAVLGIALGTALFVGIQSALGSATAAFESANAALQGKATHVVRAGPDGVPAEVLGLLVRDHDVLAAAPVTEGHAFVQPAGGRVVHWFGCDPQAEAAFGRAFGGVGAAAGSGAHAAVVPLVALLTEPAAFAGTAATLLRLGIGIGDSVDLMLPGSLVRARCALVLPPRDGLDDVLVVDIATAQEWSGRPRAVDRIDLVLRAEHADATVARLSAGLGAGLCLEPAERHAGFAELTAAFRQNLQALGLMALLVGAFLVHAAMRAAVAGRLVEFALLRALGASSWRLFYAVGREALLLGLGGSALGCALGLLAAQALVHPLVRALNDHYAAFSLTGVRVDAWLLLLALLLGTLVAVVAALGPAHEAATAPPRAVFVRGRLPHRGQGVPWPLLVMLGAVGVALLVSAGPRVALAHAGLLLAMLAVAGAVPRALAAVLWSLARLFARAGPWLAWLFRSTAESRWRTGSATAALVLAVALTTGLGMMIASFRGSVATWLGQALPADVYVGVPGRFVERQGRVLEPAIVAAIEALPGVAAVSRHRRCQLDAAHGERLLRRVDTLVLDASPAVLATLPLLHDAATVRARFAAGAGALVSEPLAFQAGLQEGDELLLQTDRGPRRITVLGVVRDYRNARGELTVPASWYGPTGCSSLALEAAKGVDAEVLAQDVRAAVHGFDQWLDVDSQAVIRVASLRVFDRTFAVTAALRLLCIGVAVLGIYGAFSALQHERQHEVGILRALGARPRHVLLLVLGQTTLLGVGAGVMALPVGYGIGLALVHAINRGAFGWTLVEVTLPPGLAVESFVLAVAAAFVAGIEPALRLLRVQPAVALREG